MCLHQKCHIEPDVSHARDVWKKKTTNSRCEVAHATDWWRPTLLPHIIVKIQSFSPVSAGTRQRVTTGGSVLINDDYYCSLMSESPPWTTPPTQVTRWLRRVMILISLECVNIKKMRLLFHFKCLRVHYVTIEVVNLDQRLLLSSSIWHLLCHPAPPKTHSACRVAPLNIPNRSSSFWTLINNLFNSSFAQLRFSWSERKEEQRVWKL